MFDGYVSLAAVGLATALAILFWPSKAAALLLLFAPIIWAFGSADINSKEATGPPNVAMAVSGAATLMYAPLLLLRYRNPEFKWLQTASIAYCVAILPSVFVSASSVESFKGYLRLVSPVIFMFGLLRGSRPRGVNALHFKAIAFSSLCLFATVLLAQYSGEGWYALGGFDRLRAFNLSALAIAEYSVAVVSVLVCGVLMGKRHLVYGTAIVGLVVCTYLTGFRTAWIGMAVLVGLVMVIAVRSGLAKFVALLIALGMVGASGIIIQSLARYAHDDEQVSIDNVTSGRITTDSIALSRYLAGTPAEWIFGIGVHSSRDATLEEEGTAFDVHSDFLAHLIECGVVGALAYVLLLTTIGSSLFRRMRYLPQGHAARTFAAVGFASFVAVTIMGIPGAMYNNVFVGWYYYGFLGFVLAQIPNRRASYQHAEGTVFQASMAGSLEPAARH
ncbi:MAG: O-antigen ligase family protein [Bryobacteraceae bacterium]